MPELNAGIEEQPIDTKPIEATKEKSRMTLITAVFLAGASLGGIGGVELSPSDIDDIVSNAQVVELKEVHKTIPATETEPIREDISIPTTAIMLDSTIRAGDKITVVIQRERDGVLIDNQAIKCDPIDADIGGQFRIKTMVVR